MTPATVPDSTPDVELDKTVDNRRQRCDVGIIRILGELGDRPDKAVVRCRRCGRTGVPVRTDPSRRDGRSIVRSGLDRRDPDAEGGVRMQTLSAIAADILSQDDTVEFGEQWHNRVQQVLDVPSAGVPGTVAVLR